MNAAERAFLTALGDESREATVALRVEVEKLAGSAVALQNFDVDLAWAKIEKAAAEIVSKSHKPLSEAQAVARVLRERPELYDAYQQAQNGRHEAIEKARCTTAQRHLAESAEERLGSLVAKYVDAGMDPDSAVDAALQRRPDLAAQCGVDLPEPVAKGAGALAAIDREARREMARDRSVSHATATARALARNPRLYTAYLAEVNGDNTPDDEPANEEWPPETGRAASVSPLDAPRVSVKVKKTARADAPADPEHPFYRKVREAHERLAEMARERMAQ